MKDHGRSLYNQGCRCEVCKLAAKEYNRQRAKKPKQPAGDKK